MRPAAAPPQWYGVALWLAGGTLAFLLCLSPLSAAFVDGHFIPADHDSFYHGRRILDAVAHPWSVAQFDSRIHVPEGSWITWPWAYDSMMAGVGALATAAFGTSDPMAALVLVAPLWTFINVGLFVAVTGRLALAFPLRIVAVVAYAVSNLTHSLHRIGMLDHHYVEHSFVLLTLLTGLRWFAVPARRGPAVWMGVVLGVAPAFHNGLFVLQLPVLATLFLLWCGGIPLPRRTAASFGLALVASTLLMLLPSEPFRRMMFSYSLHSWFHLYVAVLSAAVAMFWSSIRFRMTSLMLNVFAAALAALPLLAQIGDGSQFMFGEIMMYQDMDETRNPLRVAFQGGADEVGRHYSELFWLLPAGLAFLAWRLRARHAASDLFFAAMTVFGVGLMSLQFRFQYFGSFALYLLPLLAAHDLSAVRARWRAAGLAFVASGFTVAMLPSVVAAREELPPAADFQYALTAPIYPALQKACAGSGAGVVLAEHGDGHYIRYHSECSVISDNFILTQQHQEKVLESAALLSSSYPELLKRAPYLRYIYVRRNDNVLAAESCYPSCAENRGLRQQLLVNAPPFPAGLVLLAEVDLNRQGRREVLARLFEIKPVPGGT